MTDDGGYTEHCVLCGKVLPHDHSHSEWADFIAPWRSKPQPVGLPAPVVEMALGGLERVIEREMLAEASKEIFRLRACLQDARSAFQKPEMWYPPWVIAEKITAALAGKVETLGVTEEERARIIAAGEVVYVPPPCPRCEETDRKSREGIARLEALIVACGGDPKADPASTELSGVAFPPGFFDAEEMDDS